MIPPSDEVRFEPLRRFARAFHVFARRVLRLIRPILEACRRACERLFPYLRHAAARQRWYASYRQARLLRSLPSWPVTDGSTLGLPAP